MKRISPYLLLLIIWGLFACLQVGFDSPDEHFPTLEAASGLVFGIWDKTWEWNSGLRTFLQPLLISAPLELGRAIGIENRLWLDTLARLMNVLWYAMAVWGGGRIARAIALGDEQARDKSARRAQLWLAAAWPLAVYGTRHGSDPFVIAPMLAGFGLLIAGRGTPAAVGAGALLGVSCELRFPAAVPIAWGGVAWWVLRREHRRATFCASAALFIFGTLEALDAWLYARRGVVGVIPAREFFRFNILQGSGQFHASPWYELVVDLLLLWTPALGWLALSKKGNAWAWATTLASIATLSLVRHKELRFVLPLVPIALIASAGAISAKHARIAVAVNAILLLAAAVFYSSPHGSLARGLDRASALPAGDAQALGLVDVSGNLPEFYLRRPMPIAFLGGGDWNAICGGCASPLARTGQNPSLSWIFLAPDRCPQKEASAPSGCELVDELSLGPGYALRERILHRSTRAPRWLYRCRLRPSC